MNTEDQKIAELGLVDFKDIVGRIDTISAVPTHIPKILKE